MHIIHQNNINKPNKHNLTIMVNINMMFINIKQLQDSQLNKSKRINKIDQALGKSVRAKKEKICMNHHKYKKNT